MIHASIYTIIGVVMLCGFVKMKRELKKLRDRGDKDYMALHNEHHYLEEEMADQKEEIDCLRRRINLK